MDIICYGVCTPKCTSFENGDCKLHCKKADTVKEEMNLFGDLIWWDRLTANISAWIQIILHRIKREL